MLNKSLLLASIISLLLPACTVMQGETASAKVNNLSPENNHVFTDAISAMKSGETDNARRLLLKLVDQQPNFANAHVNLGILFVKNKSFDKAENSFKQALKIEPDNVFALNQIGFLYRTQGNFSQAKTSYEKAIDIKSDYAYAHLNLGILYDLYLYDLEKAIEQYKIYQVLSNDDDKTVHKWIVELERRYKKSLAQK